MSSQLRKRLKFAEVERVSQPVKRSSGLPEKKRIEKLNAYLKENTCITRAEYARLTGLLKDQSIRDLNKFIEKGWLRKYGAGRTVVYLSAKKEG